MRALRSLWLALLITLFAVTLQGQPESNTVVCFITGSGEHSITDAGVEGYSILRDRLEQKQFSTREVSLIGKPEVPAACTVVIAGGSKQDYAAAAADALKAFVRNGGSLILTLDAVVSLPRSGGDMGNTPQLVKMVADWGITAKGDFIVDVSAEAQRLLPTAPVVDKYGAADVTGALADQVSLMPMTRSIETRPPSEPIFLSSPESWSMTNPAFPLEEAAIEKGVKGPFILGAAATIHTGDKTGHVVVTGSSLWLSNSMLNSTLANHDLTFNIVRWLTH